MLFLDFLHSLQNIEKTRNFNVFQSYSLDGLSELFQFVKSEHGVHKPIRISVVGTNGKGSTSHYLASLLSVLGFKTGLYTSPHLLSPLERFQIFKEGKPAIPKEVDVETFFSKIILPNLEKFRSLSYFEFLTVFSYLYFAAEKTEFEIWEAGLGGRLDATKLVEADFLVLTKIGLDHSEILGDTKEKICLEKLGILTEVCRKLVAMDPEDNSLRTIIQNFSGNKTRLQILPLEKKPTYLETNFLFSKTTLSDLFPEFEPKLKSISFERIGRPKGRMEVLNKSPEIVFDPAHNPVAITTTTLEFSLTHQSFVIVLGSLPDKDREGILLALENLPLESLYLWEGPGFGSFSELPEALKTKTVRVQTEEELKALFQGRSPVLVLGSFRLYGIVANLIQNTINM
ncbi:bifunctional folylpolyglutamate synthase/dihydrofolate synthase [Leptospira congkakensis]|uniref:Bifunctional folylpolyglutamate synthase/dihydrofolate synthase n=1 Tax=Leptospira congkakensis TaxID=2484932 RepID=A0A4Z1A8U5_9LEPT|nr:Mur ligase family protein [Leptospira congkakensis]TGL87726.1 bifunctional folylpolyglutamate synthase/dihydrofolate synthase [Leptospira congkakensis]TGL89658.1 bifunctional folylpolyglutamate synthase/dihydrofolate synthase [Leptospira congkakensis]TGL95876.1 bifunctional folylpolyglutamate synthase/dihydrofolate synthase [Leptospira congkakensis]